MNKNQMSFDFDLVKEVNEMGAKIIDDLPDETKSKLREITEKIVGKPEDLACILPCCEPEDNSLMSKAGRGEFINWYAEFGKKMGSLDGSFCDKQKRCLKEINPDRRPGVFFGTPFLCEAKAGACWQCVAQADTGIGSSCEPGEPKSALPIE